MSPDKGTCASEEMATAFLLMWTTISCSWRLDAFAAVFRTRSWRRRFCSLFGFLRLMRAALYCEQGRRFLEYGGSYEGIHVAIDLVSLPTLPAVNGISSP